MIIKQEQKKNQKSETSHAANFVCQKLPETAKLFSLASLLPWILDGLVSCGRCETPNYATLEKQRDLIVFLITWQFTPSYTNWRNHETKFCSCVYVSIRRNLFILFQRNLIRLHPRRSQIKWNQFKLALKAITSTHIVIKIKDIWHKWSKPNESDRPTSSSGICPKIREPRRNWSWMLIMDFRKAS